MQIITQNVDDLHERAGSTAVLHLHGELFSVRSTVNDREKIFWQQDLNLGDRCSQGHQLRPDIVWFGEQVPLLPMAAQLTAEADILIIIGTSMQVYPAASLIDYANPGIPVFFIDPRPSISPGIRPNLEIIAKKAADGVPSLVADLVAKAT